MSHVYQMNVLAGVAVLLLLDVVWVATVMAPRYANMIATIQQAPLRPRWGWALAAYATMVVGLLAFCVRDGDHPRAAAARGALFGWVIYAVYDFTSLTVLNDFSVPLACLDVAWGSILFAAASAVAAW